MSDEKDKPDTRVVIGKIEQLDAPGGFNAPLTDKDLRDTLGNVSPRDGYPKPPFSDDMNPASREEAEKQAAVDKGAHPSPHAARDRTEEWDMRKAPDHPVSLDDARYDPVPAPTSLSVKDTNPKDAVGTKKWRQYCTVPTTILWELGVAMLEGARKYGRHNYRIAGVRASVYVDAAKGHIDQWWEGEDLDEDSKLNHITKAIASLVVLRDAMICERWVDDRPPKVPLDKIRKDLQVAVDSIFERIPVAKDAYLEGDQYDV